MNNEVVPIIEILQSLPSFINRDPICWKHYRSLRIATPIFNCRDHSFSDRDLSCGSRRPMFGNHNFSKRGLSFKIPELRFSNHDTSFRYQYTSFINHDRCFVGHIISVSSHDLSCLKSQPEF